YFALNDPMNNWAQCRHHYANAGNSPTVQKAQAEIDWHLLNLSNRNSAASASKAYGCGFLMTEGGIDDKPATDADKAARIAGGQRIVDDCQKRGYGWCLWSEGDWSSDFDTYGAQIQAARN